MYDDLWHSIDMKGDGVGGGLFTYLTLTTRKLESVGEYSS